MLTDAQESFFINHVDGGIFHLGEFRPIFVATIFGVGKHILLGSLTLLHEKMLLTVYLAISHGTGGEGTKQGNVQCNGKDICHRVLACSRWTHNCNNLLFHIFYFVKFLYSERTNK